ncbi:hypothetical protein Tco_1012807 [Tanacetum coccineum]
MVANKPSPIEDQEEAGKDMDDASNLGANGPKDGFEANEESKQTSSEWTDDFESDDEVDEVLFLEDNEFGDQFDIWLKGQVRK